MRFDFSDDQHEIKRTARELLAARSGPEQLRKAAESGTGQDDALWSELCELGWPGIAIAEEHGGQGLGLVELCVLAEELGYACAAVPLVPSAAAALVIEHGGSDDQRAQWLGDLASGELVGAIGAPGLVAGATDGALAVLTDDAGGASVAGPGTAVEAIKAIDPTRRYGRIDAAGDALSGDVAAGLDRAAVVVAAELVGICQRALDMTLAYVKDRKQFGVAVGTFQAVQHTAAQMLRDTEAARAVTYSAAWAADAAPEGLPLAAAMAKASASDAGRAVTASAIQLHGGIGFTWEADVHWLYKRAQLDAPLLGGAGAHRARVARLAAEGRAAVV